jgi:hypothetical protein
MKRRLLAMGLVGVLLAGLWGGRLASAGGQQFDRLTDADRKVFAERFEQEVWPLLTRGGKDGCVGCHRGGGIVSALRMSGNVDKDFRMLLKEGFFLHPDAGSLLARVTERDEKRRMPHKWAAAKKEAIPGEPWPEKDIQILRNFVVDVDKKQQKK